MICGCCRGFLISQLDASYTVPKWIELDAIDLEVIIFLGWNTADISLLKDVII